MYYLLLGFDNRWLTKTVKWFVDHNMLIRREHHANKSPLMPMTDLIQKHPFSGVLIKRCSENMQQIYRQTPMPKYDFNKVAKQRSLKSHFGICVIKLLYWINSIDIKKYIKLVNKIIKIILNHPFLLTSFRKVLLLLSRLIQL